MKLVQIIRIFLLTFAMERISAQQFSIAGEKHRHSGRSGHGPSISIDTALRMNSLSRTHSVALPPVRMPEAVHITTTTTTHPVTTTTTTRRTTTMSTTATTTTTQHTTAHHHNAIDNANITTRSTTSHHHHHHNSTNCVNNSTTPKITCLPGMKWLGTLGDKAADVEKSFLERSRAFFKALGERMAIG